MSNHHAKKFILLANLRLASNYDNIKTGTKQVIRTVENNKAAFLPLSGKGGLDNMKESMRMVVDCLNAWHNMLYGTLLMSTIDTIIQTHKDCPKEITKEQLKKSMVIFEKWERKYPRGDDGPDFLRKEYEKFKNEVKIRDIKLNCDEANTLSKFIVVVEKHLRKDDCEELIENFVKKIESIITNISTEEVAEQVTEYLEGQ